MSNDKSKNREAAEKQAKINAEAKETVLDEKAKVKKEAAEKQVKINAEAKARLEIEKQEEAEAKEAAEKAKIKAKKEANEAVAKAKKAKAVADAAQAEADVALAALDDTEVKCIIIKKDIALTVAVPGHPEINILKKFTAGEKVTRLAFIRQVMTCGLAEYEVVEKG